MYPAPCWTRTAKGVLNMHKNVSARPRSKGNTVWALIMSWLSSLLLTLLAFFLVLLTTICSPAFMKQQVARSGFSETAYTYLYDNFVSYGASSGFSADVMTSAISRDQITADMDSAVTRLYDGDTALDSRDSIQTATYDALLANLNARGVDVTSDVESAVAIVADACRLDYANYVAIPLASQLYTIIEKFDHIVPISVAAMALVCAASIFLMLRLAASPRFAVRCLTFAFTASAVLCSIRMENEEYETIDLLEVLNAVRQHLLAVILTTLILACAGFGVSKFLMTPKYQASALMIVNTRQDTTSNVTSDQINSATKLVSTYSIIIKSDTVLQQVINNLGLSLTYPELAGRVTVSAVDDTQVMKVTVLSDNPEWARQVCEQITVVSPDVILESVEAGSVKVISSASINPDPVSPNTMRNTAMGGVAGLVISLGIIFLTVLLDNKINTEEDVTKYLDLTVVGVIPEYEGGKKK